jgi:hypothetical protein
VNIFVLLDIAAIAEALDCKICVRTDKKKILDCLEDVRITQRLTLNRNEARVHVVNMNQLNVQVCESSFTY